MLHDISVHDKVMNDRTSAYRRSDNSHRLDIYDPSSVFFMTIACRYILDKSFLADRAYVCGQVCACVFCVRFREAAWRSEERRVGKEC